MKRKFIEELNSWKDTGMKKPLLVIGARQIGKTYVIEEFIKKEFKDCLSFNLEKDTDIRDIFEKSIDDRIIMQNLELYLGRKIDIENTILFFDEVQVSENFIVSLKYFNESKNNYKIICAGSLLGVKLNHFNKSFPVGKVEIKFMNQMNFEEVLIATGNEMLRDKIIECYNNMTPLPDVLHNKLLEIYKKYLCVGGMPEAVQDFIKKDLDVLLFDKNILFGIREMYIADMSKYVKNNLESIKIEKVYNNIPTQLAKENKKFQYNLLDKGARKRKFQSAIEWLMTARLILMNHNANKVEIPLKVYKEEDSFKMYLNDVGILTNLSELSFSDIMLDKNFMFKGALAENYVAEELNANKNALYYWTSGQDAEVDFLLYSETDGIIPIEVKSGVRVSSKSLNVYIEKYKPNYAIRVSAKNFGYENNIKSVPLYAAFCIK
ncbi:MAG: ATP-binding protein [Lachnospiraceae bacterium]|nr:ATP-binding protein [Lachnospiraceae bacterium]